MFINSNTAKFSEFQTGVFWQADFWFYAQPENHGVGGQSLAALQHHDGGSDGLLLRRRLERYDGIVQMQGNAIGLQLRLQPGSHFRVEGRHHLGQRFHHRHVEPAMPQLLGHFESDITAADYDGATTVAVLRPRHDAFHVRNVSHHEMIRAFNSGDGRPQGRCARGEYQRVVGFCVFAASL